MTKPIDLDEARARRALRADEAAHARGQAFAFEPYDFVDEDVGIIDGERRIVVMTSPLVGLAMTVEDAMKLGVALIRASGSPFLNEDEKTG